MESSIIEHYVGLTPLNKLSEMVKERLIAQSKEVSPNTEYIDNGTWYTYIRYLKYVEGLHDKLIYNVHVDTHEINNQVDTVMGLEYLYNIKKEGIG